MRIELVILCGYFACLMLLTRFSYRRQTSATDFILGSRSLGFWLTALSAHASDMSGWLFLGYPALIFEQGLFAAWAAIGLIVGMWINWQYVAPRLRRLTEELGAVTLSGYFEKRFGDASGKLRLISGLMSVFFFTAYVSSGLCAMGILVESLLGIDYNVGVAVGLCIVSVYVWFGGYRTVAWVDLFQGCFLMTVILFVPWVLLRQIGGFGPVLDAAAFHNATTSLLPHLSGTTLFSALLMALGWGLGYFGQPHILTKFMGIQNVQDMSKAKWVGLSWQTLTLGAATKMGLIGIYLFPQGLIDAQQVTLNIVKTTLSPLFAGLVLCAIVAATTNVMAAHILVVASNLSEDFYKQFVRPLAPSKELLLVSRLGVVGVALLGLVIALVQPSSVYQIVLYSWSGLGAAFGPLVLLSLYMKTLHAGSAFTGILVGGSVAALWPTVDIYWGLNIPAIIPGFVFSGLAIVGVAAFSRRRQQIDLS